MDEIGILSRMVDLATERDTLKARLRQINEEFSQLEEIALTIFEQRGVQNMTINGRTLYVSHMLAAKLTGDRHEATEWVRGVAPELVAETFNLNSLSAWLREIVQEEGGNIEQVLDRLGDDFAQMFELRTWASVKVRKA